MDSLSLTTSRCAKVRRGCGIAIAVLLLLHIAGCRPVVEQPVSGPLTLADTWTEVRPPSPLRVKKDEQAVRLELPGIADIGANGRLELAGDKSVTLAGEVVDDHGTVYPLTLGAITGGRHAFFYRAGDHPPGPDFPVDRTIVTLRLRSDPPVDVEEVRWVCSAAR